jgi:F-type H+-transporting ATPase subunit delta
MKINRRARREAKQLFRVCLVNRVLDENRVRQVVQRIVAASHRDGGAILSHFGRLVKLDLAQHTATIESATPLPADLQAAIKGGLMRRYGSGLTTAFAHRPALIGGMRIQVGSDVFDGSVRAGLAALESSF